MKIVAEKTYYFKEKGYDCYYSIIYHEIHTRAKLLKMIARFGTDVKPITKYAYYKTNIADRICEPSNYNCDEKSIYYHCYEVLDFNGRLSY